METIEGLIEYWKQSGVALNGGASLKEIQIIEERISFKFPQTFKRFYSEINGFKNCDWNENMFTIYPIERIEAEYFDSKKKFFVPFCDFLINSHQIGFYKNDSQIYIDYDLNQ